MSIAKVAIIGAGHIGASITRAAAEKLPGVAVTLYDQSDAVRARAREIKLGAVADTPQDAVRDADLVILCVPVGAMGAAYGAIEPALKPGAILSDVGSVKAAVIGAIKPRADIFFVPGHPLAGTEQSGPESGFATLFDNRWCILTPPPGTDEAAVATLTAFWTALGSKVETMDPRHHDLVLGITSHVPHLIAYNIVGTAADLEEVTQSEVIKFSAGGFRDFTRIAASDPTMWRDVFLHNKEAVLEMLGRFTEDLNALSRAIRFGEGEVLYNRFAEARAIRRSIIQAGQDTALAGHEIDAANRLVALVVKARRDANIFGKDLVADSTLVAGLERARAHQKTATQRLEKAAAEFATIAAVAVKDRRGELLVQKLRDSQRQLSELGKLLDTQPARKTADKAPHKKKRWTIKAILAKAKADGLRITKSRKSKHFAVWNKVGGINLWEDGTATRADAS